MRIGELAREAGVAPTAVRYYEQAGLLPPPRRTRSGYRAYDREALRRLQFIRAAQAVGLKLSEIREVIAIRERGSAPCRHVLDLVERRRAEVAARISELRRLDGDLAKLAEQGHRLNPRECEASDVCLVIPVERIDVLG